MDIVLIGMPGCGKTTLGRILSRRIGRKFWDLDARVEKEQGRTISEIFEKEGEPYFRKLEKQALIDSMDGGSVISTGGGIVLDPENVKQAKKGGVVVWIDRPLEHILGDIKTGSRPLLKEGKDRLYQLYETRYPLYEQAADIKVINRADLETAIQKIINEVKKYETHGN